MARDGRGSIDSQATVKGKTSRETSPGNLQKAKQHEASETVEKSKPEELIWAGQSGGFAILWTSADIQARPLKDPDRIVFSAVSLAKQGLKNFLPLVKEIIQEGKTLGKKWDCLYEREFTLLSIVGSLLSFRDIEFRSCPQAEAHPSLYIRFTTVDLSRPEATSYAAPASDDPFLLDINKSGKVTKLTDIFPGQKVLQALLADPIINEQLTLMKPPQTPEELFQVLKGDMYTAFLEINEILYELPQDFLSRFAFHHVKGNQVAIRLGISSMGAARSLQAHIGLLLPIPMALKRDLEMAKSGKAGFLMKDHEKLSRGQKTEVKFVIENDKVRGN